MIVTEEVLEHHGVKGMKWGVRKRQNFRDRRAKRTQKIATRQQKVATKYPSAVNRQGARKTQAKADRAKRWADGKPNRGDKAHRALSAAAAVGLGGIAIAAVMSSRGQTKVRDIPKGPRKGPSYKSASERLIREEHASQLSSLKRMHVEGKMDAAQFKSFSDKLAIRYDKKVAAALKAL